MKILNVVKLIQYIGIFVALVSFGTIAIGLIVKGKIENERAKLMKGILNIAVALFLLGSIVSILGYLYTTQNSLKTYPTPGVTSISSNYTAPDKDDSNFATKLFANILDSISNFVLGDSQNKGISGILGFQSLETLIFNVNDKTITIPPFTQGEWNAIVILYKILRNLSLALMVVMVGITIVKHIYYSTNIQKMEEVKDDYKRWAFVIIINATGLLVVQALFQFCSYLSTQLYNSVGTYIGGSSSYIFNSSLISQLKTGNILTTALIKFLYAGLFLKINLAFMARKWVLIVMTACTPLVSVLWGINKKVTAFDVWFGEILTNSVMGISYGITFTAISLVLSKSSNIIFIIMGMSMAISLAEVLRNMLQGLYARLSGINETRTGLAAMTQAGSIVGGMFGAFGASGIGTKAATASTMFSQFSKMAGGPAGGNAFSNGKNGGDTPTPTADGGASGSSIPKPSMRGGMSMASSPSTGGGGKIFGPNGEVLSNVSPLSENSGNSTNGSQGPSTEQSTEDEGNGNLYGLDKEELGGLQASDNKNMTNLMSNYNKLNQKSNPQRIGSQLGFALTSGDPQLSSAANAIGIAGKSIFSGINMARAIGQTTNQMVKQKTEDGAKNYTKGDAMRDLFGKYTKQTDGSFVKERGDENGKNYTYSEHFKAARIIKGVVRNNSNKVERLMMQDHIGNAVNRELGFNGWNDIAGDSKKS